MWLRWRLIVLIAVVIGLLFYVLYLARGALFPFIVSIILAQLLHPIVSAVETRLPGRNRYPRAIRVFTILLIYICAAGMAAGFLLMTIPPLFEESQEFVEALPDLYERARTSVESWSEEYTTRIPEELRTEVEESVAAGGGVLAAAAQGVIRRTISGASNAVTIVIGLVIVPFFLFYLLRDRQEVLGGAFSILSPRAQRQMLDVLHLVNDVIGAYVRGQLLSALIVSVLVFIGLSILGIKFAAILAIVSGLFGLVPIIGAVLGAVPGILVALASSPEKAIWVALVYIGVQLVENNVITPRIQSNAVRLHPAIVMMVLIGASEVAGLWGVIIGVPLTAAVRDVFVYFYRQWSADIATEAGTDVAAAEVGDSIKDSEPAVCEQINPEEVHEVD